MSHFGTRTRVRFNAICFFFKKTYTHGKIVNIYIAYESKHLHCF